MARRKKSELSTETTNALLKEKLRRLDLKIEMAKDFIVYSKEINSNRAFPYVSSGLKPVAMHIIWSMWANNRKSTKSYTKSAKIDGEVMNYSPHGSSYGSAARMAADYVYHIPYIDGHGSFGSAIGGPTPGASRYTEMRLSKFIEDVLFYNTKLLNMGLNYLEEDPEPILDEWVSLLPLLYITNTSGMGYTASNTWSSGNLLEFKEQLHNYIDNGEVDCSKLYPDFPTGGVIVNKSDMKSLYETGKGTIKLRGKTEIVGDTIRILSLPYQVFPEQFIDDVKKYKERTANTIKDLKNMSGMKGFLIEIECEKGTAEYTRETLFKKTCLQVKIADERKAIDKSGKPTLITFKDYLTTFIEDNINLVIKEANLNIKEITDRLEIVDGLLNALDIIDDIIKTIKKSKSMNDAKETLMKTKIKGYTFTKNQAEAIVTTPLGRLANLEQVKLHKEKEELTKKLTQNTKLSKDRTAQEKFFLKRFDKLVDEYGWERKTEVIDIADIELEEEKIKKPKQLKPKKEFMVVLTDSNCLKRIEVAKFRQTNEDEKNIKVQGNQRVVLVSNKGNMYKVMSNQIDKCLPTASGTDIVSIRPEINDEHIIAIYTDDVDIEFIYFVTKNGYGKMSKTKDTLGLSKTVGTFICGLKPNDEIIAIKLLKKDENIEITTNLRKILITDLKPQGRGACGKRVINLKKDETILEVHSN